MKKIIVVFTLLFVLTVAKAQVGIVPLPNKVSWGKGSLSLGKKVTISYGDNSLKPAAEYLCESLKKTSDRQIAVVQNKKGTVRLQLTSTGKPGSYHLLVNKSGILIESPDYGGLISGVASLRQMFLQDKLQYVDIHDFPRFGWRGFMLDCSRHFFSKAEIKELINVMALYKLDKFHWHLTDDQGWRIEIKKYPLLTEKGAWRKYDRHDRECLRRAKAEDNPDMLLPMDKQKIVDGDTLYGGYYTQNDIKEIVRFAKDRGIDIIPEIDMPGHFLSAVSNYKGISCFDNKIGWGTTFSSPICPGKDYAIEFCKNIWKEVFKLFPYKYVHIGGDEVEKENWKKCPDCHKRITENNLKNEEELQAWFIHEMEKYFNQNNRQLIGWDEIIEGGLSKTATVSWWRTWIPTSVDKATKHGNDVIFCPGSPFYLDAIEEPSSLERIYKYDFQADKLSDAQKEHILGVQGNLWTEWVPSKNRMQYMYFPRILAISEAAWTMPNNKNWENFEKRLPYQYKLLQKLGVIYRIPSFRGLYNMRAFAVEDTLRFSCADSTATIRYTVDGTFPNNQSKLYTGDLLVDETTNFMIRAFSPTGRGDAITHSSFVKQGYLEPMNLNVGLKDGLGVDWYDFAGADCRYITNSAFKHSFVLNDVVIPSEAKGNIGLVIKGYINVPETGKYTFALKSDDGSWLKLDGNMVVDNNREQSPHEEICQQLLKKGYHSLEVRYFDHNGGMLQLKVIDPHGKVLSPQGLYYRR